MSLEHVLEDSRFHGEGSTLEHIKLFLKALPDLIPSWMLAAGILHDIGKKYTNSPEFKGHEEKSYTLLKERLHPKECFPFDVDKTLWIIKNHGTLLNGEYKAHMGSSDFDALLRFHFFDSMAMEPPLTDSFYSVRNTYNALLNPLSSTAIQITSKCNLKCTHCYSVFSGHFKDDLSLETMTALFSDLKISGLDSVVLFGGEPFLRPDINAIVKTCIKSGLEPEVITNGTLINEKTLALSRSHGLRKIAFSLDGCRTSHEKMRGGNTFASTQDAIRTSKTLGYKVRVNTVVTKSNKDSVIPLIHDMDGEVDIHKIIYFTPFGRGELSEWIPPGEWVDFCKTIQRIDLSGKTELAVEQPYRATMQTRYDCMLEHPIIASNGDVYPCILFLNSAYTLGNINAASFQDIYQAFDLPIGRENPFCKGYSHIMGERLDTPASILQNKTYKMACPLIS